MAMSQQITPTKFHHQAYQQDTEITTLTQEDVIRSASRNNHRDRHHHRPIKTGTGLAGPDPIPITTDIGATVAVIHKEVALDPITDPHATAHHATEAQAHIFTDETPHTADPHHTEVSRDNSRSGLHTSHKHHHKTSTRPSSSSSQTTWKHKQVTIDDPTSKYYSSDEQASDSEDDLN